MKLDRLFFGGPPRGYTAGLLIALASTCAGCAKSSCNEFATCQTEEDDADDDAVGDPDPSRTPLRDAATQDAGSSERGPSLPDSVNAFDLLSGDAGLDAGAKGGPGDGSSDDGTDPDDNGNAANGQDSIDDDDGPGRGGQDGLGADAGPNESNSDGGDTEDPDAGVGATPDEPVDAGPVELPICSSVASDDEACVVCRTDADCPGSPWACLNNDCSCTLEADALANDPNNCGACGNVCNSDNGEAVCIGGECRLISCNDGWGDCNRQADDGCETEGVFEIPPAPKGVHPHVGAYTGSLHAPPRSDTLRPRFDWTPSTADCGGVSYEVQLDDSCSAGALASCPFDSPEVVAYSETSTWLPEEPLPVSSTPPVGALYSWRVRACDGTYRCSDWSAVAYAHVGRLLEDLNGDGYADLFAKTGDVDSGVNIAVLPGAPAPASSDVVNIPLGERPVSVVDYAGDIDGDGYGDLVFGYAEDPAAPLGNWVIVVLRGNNPLTLDALYHLGSGPAQTFNRLVGAGDVNGDGFADVLGWWNVYSPHYILGPDGESGAFLRWTDALPPPAPVRVGDVNGDGLPDMATVSGGNLTAYFAGTEDEPDLRVVLPIYVDPDTANDCRIAAAKDLNAGGMDDLVVGCSGGYAVYLSEGLPASFGWFIDEYVPTPMVLPAADYGGTGVDKAVLGPTGRLWFWESPVPETPQLEFTNVPLLTTSAQALDLNGDGILDIVDDGQYVSGSNLSGALITLPSFGP